MRLAAVVFVMLAACSSAPPADPPPPETPARRPKSSTGASDDLNSAPVGSASVDEEPLPSPAPSSSGSAKPGSLPPGCTNLPLPSVKIDGGTAPTSSAPSAAGGTVSAGTFVESTRWYYGTQYTQTSPASWSAGPVQSMRFSANGTFERVWPTANGDVKREGGKWHVEGDELVFEITCIAPQDGTVTYSSKVGFTATNDAITLYQTTQGTLVEQTFAKN